MGKKLNLGAAMANLGEANAVADATSAKMKAQTNRLEDANSAMDEIGANLEKTNALTGELEDDTEPGWWEMMMGAPSREKKKQEKQEKAQAALQEEAQAEVAKYADKEPIKQGWLDKRGLVNGTPWEPIYCCLFPSVLSFYADEDREVKKSDIALTATTKVHMFTKGNPPGDGVRHRPDRPFGFVIDPKSDAGRDRAILLFDGKDRSTMIHWLKHVDRVAKALKKKAEEEAAKGGDDLDAMNAMLDTLGSKADEMGAEAQKQADLVDAIDSKVDAATDDMKSQTARLKAL